jgi:hypothetical protein
MSLPGENNQAIINYAADTGEIFQISQKAKDATAVGNFPAPFRQNQGLPPRWKGRYVTIEVVVAGQLYSRRLVIADANNPIYRGQQNTVVIDGVTWRVKSRNGESAIGPYHS